MRKLSSVGSIQIFSGLDSCREGKAWAIFVEVSFDIISFPFPTSGNWLWGLNIHKNDPYFKGNIFLILVSDDPAALTDFLKKLKTENIDIDASGRPCKEKMSKVLASNCPLEDYTCDDMQSWNNKIDIETEAAFQVVPFTERKRQFRELTLEKLYTDFASFWFLILHLGAITYYYPALRTST